MVDVVQLVRMLDCGSRGRRFKSGLPPKKKPICFRIGFFIPNTKTQITIMG